MNKRPVPLPDSLARRHEPCLVQAGPFQAPDGHSPNLDVLRALAVSFVVISHLLIEHAVLMPGGYHVQSLGTLGVLVFFVHTCLVLMRSLERQFLSEGRRAMAVRFLLMRVFRIYPMSMVVVTLAALVGQLGAQDAPSLATLASNLFLVQNLTGAPSMTPVLWSLPFEVQMYLFLPALFLLAHRAGRRAWRWVSALWLGTVLAVLLAWKLGLNYELVKYFPCFLPGGLAYCLREHARRCRAALLFVPVVGAAALFPLLVGMGASATILSWGVCLVLGILIPHCGDVRTPWIARYGACIARYSYGIYLVHVPVLKFCFRHLEAQPRIVPWLAFFGGVALLSFLAYHCIEKPGIAYGRLLARRLPGNPALRTPGA